MSLSTRKGFDLQGTFLVGLSSLFVTRQGQIRTQRCSSMTYFLLSWINSVKYSSPFQFLSDYQCGDYGEFVMWFNEPPKKLCRTCLAKPEYRCVDLAKTAHRYRLRKKDYVNLATIPCKGPFFA